MDMSSSNQFPECWQVPRFRCLSHVVLQWCNDVLSEYFSNETLQNFKYRGFSRILFQLVNLLKIANFCSYSNFREWLNIGQSIASCIRSFCSSADRLLARSTSSPRSFQCWRKATEKFTWNVNFLNLKWRTFQFSYKCYPVFDFIVQTAFEIWPVLVFSLFLFNSILYDL